jgi:hypothetical protein
VKVKQLKAGIKAQAKELGINISLDQKPELKRNLYRKGEALTERQLKGLVDKRVPVWVEYTDTDHRARRGVFEVVSTDSESVMLEDGSCFALDFQFTGDDEQCCCDTDDDGGSIAIYQSIAKKPRR